MHLLRLISALLMVLPLTACALSGGSVSGKVLEEGTDKPISGAIVVVRWQGRVSSLVDSHRVCVHVDSTVSDEQGRYQFARWSKPSKVGPVLDLEPKVSAYKASYGYPQTPMWQDKGVYMAPFKGTSGERLEYLGRLSEGTRCQSAGESGKSMLPFRKSLYDEAKGIASSVSDMNIIEGLLFQKEVVEFGYENAERNQVLRYRGQK